MRHLAAILAVPITLALIAPTSASALERVLTKTRVMGSNLEDTTRIGVECGLTPRWRLGKLAPRMTIASGSWKWSSPDPLLTTNPQKLIEREAWGNGFGYVGGRATLAVDPDGLATDAAFDRTAEANATWAMNNPGAAKKAIGATVGAAALTLGAPVFGPPALALAGEATFVAAARLSFAGTAAAGALTNRVYQFAGLARDEGLLAWQGIRQAGVAARDAAVATVGAGGRLAGQLQLSVANATVVGTTTGQAAATYLGVAGGAAGMASFAAGFAVGYATRPEEIPAPGAGGPLGKAFDTGVAVGTGVGQAIQRLTETFQD